MNCIGEFFLFRWLGRRIFEEIPQVDEWVCTTDETWRNLPKKRRDVATWTNL